VDETSALVSLAMLKVDSDVEGRDYVDYLVPFVSYVLQRHRPEPVASASVQVLLRDEFKLRIPVHATEMVLRRFAKRKILQREHGVYTLTGTPPQDNLDELRKDARDRTVAVVNTLREFVKANHAIEWDDAQAIEAVIIYLSRFSVECLRSFAHGTALPELKESPKDQQLFLVNRFVVHVKASAPDIFEHLIVLVKGQMLSNALTCSDLESIPRKFNGVTFYLDTPLVLQIFGLEGAPLQQAATELVELVRNLKGTFAVFEHTAEEVHRVLEGAERHLDDPNAKGLVITEMRRAGKTASDLALTRAHLGDLYSKHEISKRNTPAYIAQFQIDEQILHRALEEEITYGSERAVDYDVNSIRSIYALRRGIRPARLEDAAAVLVTSNAALARAAYDYGRNHERTKDVSPVITNFSLANHAWLKAPLGSPDMPQAEVIALCYAAMNPREGLWSAYISEIDKLEKLGNITARDHELLRYSLRARDELMNLTLGSEEGFSQKTVTQILDSVKADLVKEKEQQLAEVKAIHAQTMTEAEEFRFSANAQINTVLGEQEAVRKRLYWFADRIGMYLSYAVCGTLALILAGACLVSGLFAKSLASGKLWISIPAAVLIWTSIVWGLLNWVFGFSIKDVHQFLWSRLRHKTYPVLCRLFAVKQQPPSDS